MSLRKFTITAAVSIAGALAASAAHAGPDVHWQLRVETPVIRLPGHVVLPLPPIVVPRAVVTPRHDDRGYGAPRRGDADGDGVPNRHDRVYNPRWDRDGDGTPNRYDRHPDHARDGRAWRGHEGWQRSDRRHDRHDERRRDDRDDRRGR